MDSDKDEDLLYECLEDIETDPNDKPVSSTGSLPDDDEEEEATSVSKTSPIRSKTNDRRTITWDDDDDDDNIDSADVDNRKILKPRRYSELSRSNFGLETPKEREKISEDAIRELYDGLEVEFSNQKMRDTALFVHSVKPITVYHVEKIFADFNPARCALLSDRTAVLRFTSAYETAEALIDLTKRLIRVRKEASQEEGEIVEEEENETSEDEDKLTAADQAKNKKLKRSQVVVIPKDGSRKRKQLTNTIEIDVDEVNIPPGQWQVVCKHVPKYRLVFVRFAYGFELRQSLISPYRQEVTENAPNSKPSDDSSEFKGYKRRIRPGINVFKEDGTELSWNFEHDTRFYEDRANFEGDSSKSKLESRTEEIVTKSGQKIKSRGRGSKKFIEAMFGNESD